MSYLEHKDIYLESFRKGLVGESYNDTLPNVSSSNPYSRMMNEGNDIGSFAHALGVVARDNMFGKPPEEGGEVPNGGNHHHDDRYARLTHLHDDRYYTKKETDEWRDRLINGDLLFNKINANHIQTGSIVAGSTIIAEGAIGNAQINKIDAGKIESGTIDTSKLTIAGANGNLLLRGNRLQVFEGIGTKQFERVSLGDVDNDGSIYGLRVRGADGNTILYDENGVYREGITDGSITNDKIGGDADIDGAKLNISSVIRKINEDGSETINGVKIDIDNENLTAKLNTITQNQDEHSETIKMNTSKIEANSESISLKVDEQTYKEDMSGMTSELEKQSASIEILKEGISLSATKTEVSNQIKEVTDFVTDEIGDITIGGANYLNNSAPRKAVVDEFVTWDRTLNGNHRLVYWRDFEDSVELPQVGYHAHIDLETFHFPCIALINRNAKFSMANRYLGVIQEVYKPDECITPGEEYTISFDACADTRLFKFHGGLFHRNVESSTYGYHSGMIEVRIPEENVGKWFRYSCTFKVHLGIDLNNEVYMRLNGHNNEEASGYFKNIKLERGNKVSQWTPSQFDVDDSLNDAVDSMKDYTNESIKEYKATVDVKFDNINLSVSETIKDLDGVKGSVASIDIKADQISNRVTGLDGKYTELKQTVDGINITGMVTFEDLKNPNSRTIIDGGNIKTDSLTATGAIKFADGAVISPYPSHVSGFYGMSISAPSMIFGGSITPSADGVDSFGSEYKKWNKIWSYKGHVDDLYCGNLSVRGYSVSLSNHSHSDYLPTYSSTRVTTGSITPYSSDNYNLGWSQERWNQCSARYGYFTNTYGLAYDLPYSTLSNHDNYNDIIDDVIIEQSEYARSCNIDEDRLVINVNQLKNNPNGHLFVGEDDAGNSYVNESSLLALALQEIKQLKNRVSELEKEMM